MAMEGRSWCCSRVCGAAVGTAGCWVGAVERRGWVLYLLRILAKL